MLRLTRRSQARDGSSATLTLTYDVRHKSRFRAVLDDGRDVLVQLQRGSVLRDGDVLADDAESVLVRAALEPVSVASTLDGLLLTRAAYHLGNRHVPLQIDERRLVYQHDHVLDAMLRELGLEVRADRLAFQPELGAYAHAHHDHAHED
jgi:urease accessory protein